MKSAFLKRSTSYACRTLRDSARFMRDTSLGTFGHQEPGEVIRLLTPVPRHTLHPHREALLSLAELTLQHRFDLLGSGWVEVPSPKKEHLNLSNRRRAEELRSQIDHSYQPIDWHTDFKSGHRWNQRTWHRHIRFGMSPGVDVKVPWELARMQHLPRLALAYGLKPDPRFAAEFRNELLDFGSSNPPRFGVNWFCAMDVAIRLSNWLVSYDLFRSFGVQFDAKFRASFTQVILEHARFVRSHLERRGQIRNNHYLAGITGLIFASRYLPPTRETGSWLSFSTGELIREVRHQFHADGGNFEGSTSYHRLSAEMVIFATAVLAGISDPPELPAWYCERLRKITGFTRALQMPDGTVPQIGDNDSGRFLHLTPMFQKLSTDQARARYIHLRRYESSHSSDYWDVNDQDHSHLLHAADALFNPQAPDTLEGQIVLGLSQGWHCHRQGTRPAHAAVAPSLYREPVGTPVTICDLNIGSSEVSQESFPDFGLYIFRNSDFFLSIRCGGKRGTHGHDDHLSIELHHRGEALFRDPGTFAYTPHPSLRRRYRSLAAHAVPYPVEEESDAPVFHFPHSSRSECLALGPDSFLGFGHYGGDREAYRQVQIHRGTLRITDYLKTSASFESPETIPYSPAYGKLSSEWVRGGRMQTEEVLQCVS